MAQPDPLRIVEAAYTWTESEERWLDGIVTAATPYAIGGGVVAITLTFDGAPKVHSLRISSEVAPEPVAAIRHFCSAVPASLGHDMFAPTEFVGNAAWRLQRLAKARQRTPLALTRDIPVPSMWAVVAGAPKDRSLVLGFLPPAATVVQPSDPYPRRDARVLGLVGAHLSAALRLRDLGEASAAVPKPGDVDAVLTPSGQVLHAKDGAENAHVRASLSEAVLRSERARGKMRNVDSEEATTLWAALVGGRYSIVETTERDGKRFLLARKNTFRSPDLLALTKEESDVVWLIAQGHSHKYVAYELGLSVASIVRRLRGAMLKLRVSSRRDLLRKLGLPRTTT